MCFIVFSAGIVVGGLIASLVMLSPVILNRLERLIKGDIGKSK